MLHDDTIVALASAPGTGAISVIRLSGPKAIDIAQALCRRSLTPRTATLGSIYDETGEQIDSGLFIAFPGPQSFTGENVCEFQGHGGTVVSQAVIQECLKLGAIPANPGQFSERAFLNGKIDLVQAEAISDLIHATTLQAVRAANQSLNGLFSTSIEHLADQIITLRTHIEAHLDFPDEDIAPAALKSISNQLEIALKDANELRHSARQGLILNSGLKIVLLGPPNAGKSSLLNCLAQQAVAIVTDVPGTTRDLIQHNLQLDGLHLLFVDTAGIRDTNDVIESEGIRRALQATHDADVIMCLFDHHCKMIDDTWIQNLFSIDHVETPKILLVQNKCDLDKSLVENKTQYPLCQISAQTREGIPNLLTQLKQLIGLDGEHVTPFIARERHIYQLSNAIEHLETAHSIPAQLAYLDVIAEELRLSHIALQEMTGTFHSDDLLGQIFSTFCIGK